MKKATAILTADIHLRDDQPICRTDDYTAAMMGKIAWLCDLQRQHRCPILDAGDLFERAKPSHWLLQWAIQNLPRCEDGTPAITSVAGNHDLPNHSLDLFEKSGIGVLHAAGVIDILREHWQMGTRCSLYPFPWSVPPVPAQPRDRGEFGRRVAIAHIMTYTGRRPFPGCKDPGAPTLLQKLEGYDLVLTGHNHKPFVVEHEGRLLVNPGSLMRDKADQIDHEPRVYLWYAEDNTVEPVFVPIERDVITRGHIDRVQDRDDRLDTFVEHLNGDFEISLSYEKNLENFFSENPDIRPSVRDLVWGAVKGE